MQRYFIFLVVLKFLMPGLIRAQQRIVVSLDQISDRAESTHVSSLEDGLTLASEYILSGNDVELLLTGGVYQVDHTLEITVRRFGRNENGKLRIEPFKNAEVTLSGGVAVLPAYLKPVPATEKRIHDSLHTSIYYIDLADIPELDSLVALHPVGFGRPSRPGWNELFINGRPQQLSRWPNAGMSSIGPVLDPGSVPRDGETENHGATFHYNLPLSDTTGAIAVVAGETPTSIPEAQSPGAPIPDAGAEDRGGFFRRPAPPVYTDRPSNWRYSTPGWIAGYFAHGYADDMIRVAGVDTLRKTITTAEATMYGFMTGEPFRQWYVVNMLEEVDTPGEYYLDFEQNRIWFYPEAPVETITISHLAEPIMAIEGVENVEISDITFAYGRGMGLYMEDTEHVLIKGCRFENLGSVGICMGKGVEPFEHLVHEGTGKAASRVLGSLQQHLYEDTTFDRQGGRHNGIVDCIIRDVGAGGISLHGGDRLTLEPGHNYVQNCRITRFNRIEKSYRPGIHLSGVGNRITNCEISDAPSMGILLHGNDHLIEYTEIFDVCREIDDLGAIYYGRNPSEQGIRVMYNYIHHLNRDLRVTGIYQDDGACGMYCYGNILYKAGRLPFQLGGGSDQQFINNMIIDAPFGIHVDNRHQTWGNAPETEQLFAKRLDAVHYREEPYASRYPHMVAYMEEDIKKPKRNFAHGNLFYKVRMILRDNRRHDMPGELNSLDLYNNWLTWYTPGVFEDEAAENWNVRADSPIFDYIRGFEPIPFDRIGCSLPQ